MNTRMVALAGNPPATWVAGVPAVARYRSYSVE